MSALHICRNAKKYYQKRGTEETPKTTKNKEEKKKDTGHEAKKPKETKKTNSKGGKAK